MVLVVRPDSRFKSLADLVAAARAEPGKITYGHQGPGSIPNLATEEFLQTANLRINQVPYRGDPAVLTDVLGGQIDVGALVLGSVPGQNVRILGVFAEERHPTFPDAPTVKNGASTLRRSASAVAGTGGHAGRRAEQTRRRAPAPPAMRLI
jgi:tripartite-type tricarboxylate transporter receptor subunit TctC